MAEKERFAYALLPGTVLRGREYSYRIVETLGHGTFGITYLAELLQGDEPSAMLVCIKEFFMSDINGREGSSVTSSEGHLFSNYARKFVREAQNLKKIEHDNVVKVIELFDANNTCYYSMSYLSGNSLDSMIAKSGALSEAKTLEIAMSLTYALESLHKVGMVHLDIKPGNIMMVSENMPVLIDFGLSKNFDKNGVPESSTSLGGGTPGYAPIEQSSYSAGDGAPFTMDVYALGATMYKMLTGERPPLASVILEDGFPIFKLHKLGVSDATITVIGKAMEARKAARFQTMEEMRNAIEASREKLSGERSDTPAKPPKYEQSAPSNPGVLPPPPAHRVIGETPSGRQIMPSTAENTPAPKSNKKPWIIAAVCVVIILLFFFVFLSSDETEEETVETEKTEVVISDSGTAVGGIASDTVPL